MPHKEWLRTVILSNGHILIDWKHFTGRYAGDLQFGVSYYLIVGTFSDHEDKIQIQIPTVHCLHLSDQRQDSRSHYVVNASSNKNVFSLQ